MRYEKRCFFLFFVNCNFGILSIPFKFVEYDPRPITIPPTSVEQKNFNRGVLGKIFQYFHLQEIKLIFED
jgi:hypothetical protein